MSHTDHKSHANKTPKASSSGVSNGQDGVWGRVTRKVDAVLEAKDHTSSPLSKSLLELLPQHDNNKNSSIRTADSAVAGVLYSYDTKTSPGRPVDLGGLVEQAEAKWKNEQTERMVKGEYEVLDNEGETTVLSKGRGKKGSPKQKVATVTKDVVDEDDGFELI